MFRLRRCMKIFIYEGKNDEDDDEQTDNRTVVLLFSEEAENESLKGIRYH